MHLSIIIFLHVGICHVVTLESFISSRHHGTLNKACDVVAASGRARSLVDCLTKCTGIQKSCYDKKARNCTCCYTTTVSAQVLTEETKCFQRNGLCPSGWFIVGAWCVVTHSFVVTFSDCQKLCSDSNAKILEVTSKNDSVDFVAFLHGHPGPFYWYWNNLVYKTSGEQAGKWVTVDTGLVINSTYWLSGEPNGLSSGQFCMVMDLQYNLRWLDAPCTVMKSSCACQKNN